MEGLPCIFHDIRTTGAHLQFCFPYAQDCLQLDSVSECQRVRNLDVPGRKRPLTQTVLLT